MAYHIQKQGNIYQVVADKGGKIMGTHKTKGEATEQLYALYKREKGEK